MAEVKDNPVINYIAAAAQAQASDTQAKLDVAKQMDAQASASSEAQMAHTAMGADQSIMDLQSNSWKAATDAKVAATRVAFGADPTQQGTESNYWLKEMQDNSHKAYAALDAVHEGQSKTLLNDPLGFISAQFTLPADIAAHNYFAEKYNTAENTLKDITSLSDANVIAANRAAQTTSAEYAIAQGDKAVQLAAANVATLKDQLAGTRIKGALEINALTTQQAQLAFQMHQAQQGDAHLALAKKSQEDAHANHLMLVAQRQEQLDAKAATLNDWQAQLDVRNIGAKAKGMATIDSVQMFQREYAQQGKNPVYQDMLAQGAGIQLNGGALTGVPVAENAGNAARNYAVGGVNLTSNPTASYLAAIWNSQKGLATSPKDVQALAAHVDTIAIAGAKSSMIGIDNSNPMTPNIYAAPPPAVILAAPRFSANPFIAATVTPLLAVDKNATIPDAVLLSKAADYAKVNPDNFNVAITGIVDYYKQAVLSNGINRMYTENGLPSQKGYIAKIDGANVDLTNPADVKLAIMTHGYNKIVRGFGGPFVN